MTRLLEGKVALVTGARTGLGAATVVALAKLGATVIAAGRHARDCGAVVDAVTIAGGKACDFMLDVADLDAIPHRVAKPSNCMGASIFSSTMPRRLRRWRAWPRSTPRLSMPR
nr:SDR family NAD(P)-dependent oxidoreductase [Mesorhizobium loti]